MKTSTVLTLGGLGALAWFLSKQRDEGEATSVGPGGGFDPARPEDMPDFESVVGDVSESGDDFFYDGFPPVQLGEVKDELLRDFSGSADKYAFELWRPASRISLNTITRVDLERAAMFLGGNWKRGAAQGCPASRYEKLIKDANERLLEIAEGLDIGSQVGVALASAFGFGAGAQAMDKAIGFGRGAEEQRLAMIDLADVPVVGGAGMSAELTFGNTYQFPAEYVDPGGSERRGNGYFRRPPFPTVVHFGGNPYPVLVNLFKPNLVPYDDHWSDDGLSKFVKIHREDGTDLVPIGFTYPWASREMGCYHRSKRKRMYCAARMLRTVDLIQALAFPTEPAIDSASGDLVPSADGQGLVPAYVSRFVTFAYVSKVFGRLSGTIFPPLPGDKVSLPLDSDARSTGYNPNWRDNVSDIPDELPPPPPSIADMAVDFGSAPAQVLVGSNYVPPTTAGATSATPVSAPVSKADAIARRAR